MQYAELVRVCSDGTIAMMIDGFPETEQLLPFIEVLRMKQVYADSVASKGWW